MSAPVVWHGPDALRGQLVLIADLEPWPGNPRQGDVTAVAASLRRFGQVKPIVVDGARIVAGHHVVKAAVAEGWTHVAALDHRFASEREARAFLLADNRTSELGSVDDALLLEQLRQLGDGDDLALAGTGYDDVDLGVLERSLLALDDADADDAPDPPIEPSSKPGEIYELGEHRIACGDATDLAAVRALVGSCAPEALWTDPPWGVNYVGRTSAELTIPNDDGASLPGLLDAAFAAADAILAPGARFYVAAPAGPMELEFRLAINRAGWRFHQTLIWCKDAFVLGHADHHYQHEPVLYGWKPGDGRLGRGHHPGSRWYGGDARSSVFHVARPKRSEQHPTMKPVELVAGMLADSTRPGDAVLDLFAGSGSTLIAAEQLGLRCFALEIDPGYCDVIRQRYADYAGRPELAPSGTGKPP